MPIAFIAGPAGAGADGAHAFGALRAVQLQKVRIERLHDGVELGIRRVDHERDAQGAPLRLRREGAAGFEGDVPRAFGKAHEADEIRPRGKGGVEGLGRAEAADLDHGFGGAGEVGEHGAFSHPGRLGSIVRHQRPAATKVETIRVMTEGEADSWKPRPSLMA